VKFPLFFCLQLSECSFELSKAQYR
jgi:hypothetical protein